MMGVISYILDISYKNTSIHSGGSAVGRDYELHKVFYPAYRPILHPYRPSRYKFLGRFLGFLMDSPLKSASFLKVK